MRRLLPVLLAGLALVACGDEGFAEDEDRVPAVALGEITDAREAVRALCVEGAPEPRALERSIAGLIDVVGQYPDRVAQGGEATRTRPVPEIARRLADDLERCGRPQLARQVRDAVVAAG